VDRILQLGIGRVVVGVQDPDSRVQGRSFAKLKAAGVKLEVGVAERECALWHFPFIESKKQAKQIWIGKWAQNQDGYLCDAAGESKWISGPKSRAYTHWLRQKYDVILVGAGTWLKDAPQLTVRDCATPHRRNPLRVVFDPSKRLPEKTGVLNGVMVPKVGRKIEDLKKWFSEYDFEKKLGHPVQTIFVEGGPRLLNLMLENQSLDALHVFQADRKLEPVNEIHRIRADLLKPYTKLHEQFIEQDFLQEFGLLH
jgi:diaminohydroxyphosphoribosylaminopyrimidine deaminase/5-amino-6-(5-phosphoribosylamino)uracil reductase